jgi:DNA-binding MarR family transcriptional regulator
MNSASETLSPIAGFDPLLQAPARLQVMAVLAQAQEAEFVRLKDLTACSDSVMSKHLSALADAGLIKLRKAATEGRQRTWASITRAGRKTFENHVAALQRIVAGV